jgi:hypothetical protein
MVLKGSAAKAYFKAQRLIQQACVDTCNREGWVIPFTQITVHSADATAELNKHADEATKAVSQVAVESSLKPQ